MFSSFGDPGLKAESGEGWDLAYEQALVDGKVYFTTTLFGNEVEDKIIFSFNSYTYANEDVYESKGIENAIRFQVAENASATLAYTYSDANYLDGQEAERAPRNIVSLGYDLQPAENLNLSATALSVSSQYSTRFSTMKQSGYTVFNLAGRYQVNEGTQLWARIDNLFDKDYQEVEGFQTAGFSIYGGVRFNF